MHYAYKYIMSYCMVCIIFAQVVLASIDVIQKCYVKRTSITTHFVVYRDTNDTFISIVEDID